MGGVREYTQILLYFLSSLTLAVENLRRTRTQEDKLSFWCRVGIVLTWPLRALVTHVSLVLFCFVN